MRILILLSVLTLFACGGGTGERTLESIEDDGINRVYHKNGRLKFIGEYDSKTGHRKGEWKFYYDNGQLKAIGKYDNDTGDKKGKWKSYYNDGKLKSIGKYDNGKQVGTWKSYSRMTESYNITDFDDQ